MQTILDLPENSTWTKDKLKKWFNEGGTFHAIPSVLTPVERMNFIKRMTLDGIIISSPKEKQQPMTLNYVDIFCKKPTSLVEYRTDVVCLPDNPSDYTCFYAALIFATGLPIEVRS